MHLGLNYSLISLNQKIRGLTVYDALTVMLGVTLAQLLPGPNMLAAASATLQHGRIAGLLTALGACMALLMWSAFFAYGTGQMLMSNPAFLTALRIIGGLYILYLGITTFKASVNLKRGIPIEPLTLKRHRSAITSGILVTLTNPKIAIMWVAITIYMDARTISQHQLMALGVAVALSGALVYSSYALLFSLQLSLDRYRSHYVFVAIALSGILFFVGANFLLAGSLELIKITSANHLTSINQTY